MGSDGAGAGTDCGGLQMEGEDGTPTGMDEVCIAIRSAKAGAAMGFS
jgi:hypothetical protein